MTGPYDKLSDWEWLKDKVTPERNRIAALDIDFRGTQSVYNWCQDFEMELGNAGFSKPKYWRMLIRYCHEFLDAFTDVEWLMRGNFLRAEANSHWRLGDIETAEARFEALIQEKPDWAWGYIDWSDLYWLFNDSPKDYIRGNAILKRALARVGREGRRDVIDRLRELRAEQKKAKKGTARAKKGKSRKKKLPPRRQKRI